MELEMRKLKELKEELALLGETIKDEEFALTILTAFPPSCDAFISSIGLTIPPLTDIIGCILLEDQHHKDRDRDTATALVAAQKGKFRKGVTCFKCSKEGHIWPECKELPTEANAHYTQDNDNDYIF